MSTTSEWRLRRSADGFGCDRYYPEPGGGRAARSGRQVLLHVNTPGALIRAPTTTSRTPTSWSSRCRLRSHGEVHVDDNHTPPISSTTSRFTHRMRLHRRTRSPTPFRTAPTRHRDGVPGSYGAARPTAAVSQPAASSRSVRSGPASLRLRAVGALGQPDGPYGDYPNAWARSDEQQRPTRDDHTGVQTKRLRTAFVIRETDGNGFVRKVELRDTDNVYTRFGRAWT